MVSYSHILLAPDRLMQPVRQTSKEEVASHFPFIHASKGLVHEHVSHEQISRYYYGRECFDNGDAEHFELGGSFLYSGSAGSTSASLTGLPIKCLCLLHRL